MLIGETLSFTEDFVNDQEQGLQHLKLEVSLTPKHKELAGVLSPGHSCDRFRVLGAHGTRQSRALF